VSALEHVSSERSLVAGVGTTRDGAAAALLPAPVALPDVREREVALPPSARVGVAVSEGDVREFLARAIAEDEGATSVFVRGLIDSGVTAETIYLDLLAPAARALGVYWEEDRCDFVHVTVAVGRLQRALRELSHLVTLASAAADDAGRILLSCIPGEQHTLGLFMVAEFFVRDGWAVSVGAPVATADLGALVASASYDVVGFSIACDSRLGHLKHEIARVRRRSRNRSVRILLGGRVVAEHPHLVGRIGADGMASDAAVAPAAARQLIVGERGRVT
jgi:methanogenic corrinoid protein MtbC1